MSFSRCTLYRTIVIVKARGAQGIELLPQLGVLMQRTTYTATAEQALCGKCTNRHYQRNYHPVSPPCWQRNINPYTALARKYLRGTYFRV